MLTLKTSGMIAFALWCSACNPTTENPTSTNETQAPSSSAASTNTFIAHEKLATTHFDLSQSDNFNEPVPKGTFEIDPTNPEQAKRVIGGPVNIITLKAVNEGYWWSLATDRISYIDGTGNKWEEVATYPLPNVIDISNDNLDHILGNIYPTSKALAKDYDTYWAPTKSQNPTLNMMTGNAIYAVVDTENNVYLTAAGKILKFTFDKGNIALLNSIDLKSQMAVPEALKEVIPLAQIPGGIQGVNIAYDGTLIVGTIFGLMAVNRDLTTVIDNMAFPLEYFYSKFPPAKGETPEFISNSFAIDPSNAVYVATGSRMNKVVWTGQKFSLDATDGAWSQKYATGDNAPTIKYGRGTGSTPTLMNVGKDELVVITDGANQMHLVAFWRKIQTSGNQTADQIDVTCGFTEKPAFIQSEQSVAVCENGAFVVNNIAPNPEGLRNFDEVNKVADLIFNVLAVGPIVSPGKGIERFEWDAKTHKWQRKWSNPNISSTSMVPAISASSNIVLVNTYHADKGWQIQGFDWNSGDLVHEVNMGKTSYGNGAYALIEYFDNGDLLFNGIGGPMRIPLATNP